MNSIWSIIREKAEEISISLEYMDKKLKFASLIDIIFCAESKISEFCVVEFVDLICNLSIEISFEIISIRFCLLVFSYSPWILDR